MTHVSQIKWKYFVNVKWKFTKQRMLFMIIFVSIKRINCINFTECYYFKRLLSIQFYCFKNSIEWKILLFREINYFIVISFIILFFFVNQFMTRFNSHTFGTNIYKSIKFSTVCCLIFSNDLNGEKQNKIHYWKFNQTVKTLNDCWFR